jgi:hypothetical protein
MTILVTAYASKKELKAAIGQKLRYRETSLFGPEYPADGTGSIVVARRPHLAGGGREFFAEVVLCDHIIVGVK